MREGVPGGDEEIMRLLMFAILTVFSLPACASVKSATDLLDMCNFAVRSFDREQVSVEQMIAGFGCDEYVNGFIDAHEETASLKGNKPLYCLPQGTTTEQSVRIVVKWLRDNPQNLHWTGRVAVARALMDAFTAGRNMVRAGTPQIVAMRITGHSTDAMFRRYAIVNEEQKREALAKTQAYLAQSPSRKVAVMR